LGRDGKNNTHTLANSQPAQARGQAVPASFASSKVRSEGPGPAGRPSLSQSRGQHERGSERCEEEKEGEEDKEDNIEKYSPKTG
jgi:hypothetical protein